MTLGSSASCCRSPYPKSVGRTFKSFPGPLERAANRRNLLGRLGAPPVRGPRAGLRVLDCIDSTVRPRISDVRRIRRNERERHGLTGRNATCRAGTAEIVGTGRTGSDVCTRCGMRICAGRTSDSLGMASPGRARRGCCGRPERFASSNPARPSRRPTPPGRRRRASPRRSSDGPRGPRPRIAARRTRSRSAPSG
jgi:hypothetical protein